MISRLHITNFAIVSDLDVELYPGLNILSGETGAGKSIIIGALNLLLGERAQTEMIRSGCEMAVVEGEFPVDKASRKALSQTGIEFPDGTILIRREIKRNSSSRCFINDQMVTLSDLKKIGEKLVDLVGQHHTQLLLDPANHIGFLDDFAGNNGLLEEYNTVYRQYQAVKSELGELRSLIAREKEKMELYRFQKDEIEKANLSEEEENSLTQERQILENAETLKSSYYGISGRIYHGEGSLTEMLNTCLSELSPLKKYDSDLEETIKSLKSGLVDLEEAGRYLQGRSEVIEHDPARLSEIEERLDLYYNMKKKYGGNLPELFKYLEKITVSLGSFGDHSSRLRELSSAREYNFQKLCDLADQLSGRRHERAGKLARQIEKELAGLLMGKVEFEVMLAGHITPEGEYKKENQNLYLGPDGYDTVEFLFSPNPGEEKKSLAKIASGGELSRVLLAIKTIVSGRNKHSCLIFDEIDSGIGGKTASAVGKSLQNLAEKHQVLVITHLQQIAACGENHFLVFKEKSDGRMVTRIKKLTLKQRKEEIGRMISGDRLSEISLRQAEELLKEKESGQ